MSKFVLLNVMIGSLISCAVLAQDASSPSAAGSPIGASRIEFATVAAAHEDVAKRPGAVRQVAQGGWIIFHQYKPDIVWSFAPTGHSAYPAVVKRVLITREGQIHIEMSMLCEATKASCDELHEEFRELNNRAAESARRARDRLKQ